MTQIKNWKLYRGHSDMAWKHTSGIILSITNDDGCWEMEIDYCEGEKPDFIDAWPSKNEARYNAVAWMHDHPDIDKEAH